jgi:Tfp pilus assembly protein PilO
MIEIKTKNRQLLVLGLATSILSLGGFGYLGYNDYTESTRLVEADAMLQGKIQKARREIAMIPRLEKDILQLRHRVQRHAAILPDDPEIHAYVDQLTRFSSESGVEIRELDATDVRRRAGRKKQKKEAFEAVTYKLEVAGSFDQIMSFLDMVENHYDRFVRIKSLTVKSEKATKDEEIPPLIASLDVETYVYNAKTKAGGAVKIRREDAKLDQLRAGGQLTDEVESLKGERYVYEGAKGRRDPLRDPRTKVNRTPTEAPRDRDQRHLVAGFRERFTRIRTAIAKEAECENWVSRYQIVRTNNKELGALGDELLKTYQQKLIVDPELLEEFKTEVLAPFKALAKERQIEDPFDLPEDRLRAQLVKMRRYLDSGRYREAIDSYEELAVFKKDLPPDADNQLTRFFKEAEPLVEKAKKLHEVQSLEIKITGVIVDHAHPERSLVIINGRPLGAGETVSEGLSVTEVGESVVKFTYRDFEFERPVRERPSPKGKEKGRD